MVLVFAPCARLLALAIACLTLIPGTASAQAPTSRVEVGADATVTGAVVTNIVGASGRFDLNLTPSLALETRVSTLSMPLGLGTAYRASSGVRATLVRGRRVSLYGVALPGVFHGAHFTPGAIVFNVGDWEQNGQLFVLTGEATPVTQTYFVLDMGLGVTVPAKRLLARFEFDRELHARRGVVEPMLLPSGASSQIEFPTYIGGAWTMHVGASYRFGSAIEAAEQPAGVARWTIGPQLGFTVSTSARTNSAAGAFAAYRLTRWLDLDMSVSSFLHGTLPASLYEGGRIVQAVGGVKMGVREERFGVFFKFRSGVNRDSRVLIVTGLEPEFHAVTMRVFDLGGVIETYLSPHSLLRVDLGETLAFSPDLYLSVNPYSPSASGPQLYGLPIRVGFGWRF